MENLELKILELEEKGYKVSEIANAIGKNVKFVYRHNSKAINERKKKKEANNVVEKEFEELVRKYLPMASSMNNLCNILGLRGVKGYYDKIQRIIDKYGLSTSHFGSNSALYNSYLKRKLDGNGRFIPMSDKEFFVKDSKRHGESIIKRLVDGGYKEYKCEGENCGINEWNGKPLRLQVHHINGDHTDNRIENLQLLCPNCHTQTDTYARNNIAKTNGFKVTTRVNEILNGSENSFEPKSIDEAAMNILPPKEKKYCQRCGKEIIGDGDKYCSLECSQKASRKFEVSIEQLVDDFKKLRSFSAVGRKYNVSDNAIKRRAKKLGIYDEIRQFITPR